MDADTILDECDACMVMFNVDELDQCDDCQQVYCRDCFAEHTCIEDDDGDSQAEQS